MNGQNDADPAASPDVNHPIFEKQRTNPEPQLSLGRFAAMVGALGTPI